MKSSARHIVALLSLVLVFSFVMVAEPGQAYAKTHHHKMHHVKHTKKSKAKKSARMSLRAAQEHLLNLGYDPGPIDGKMGRKTRAALKKFQREHELKVTGTLTASTIRSLRQLDTKPTASEGAPTGLHVKEGPNDFYAKHQDYYGYVDKNFSNPMQLGAPATPPSRFARVEVSEGDANGQKRFNVTINGQPVLQTDGQPSVIGVSKTYDLGREDAIIFTTFNDGNTVCPTGQHLLVMNNVTSQMMDIANCTRDYTAEAHDGSLFITFPEIDDTRPAGAVWRYENGALNKL